MDATNLTLDEIEEIQKVLDKRKTELKLEQINSKRKIAEQHIEILKQYKDIILPLIEHDRTSCSDEDPCNGYYFTDGRARCNKCHLIEILNGYHGNGFDVRLEVVIINTEEYKICTKH